MSEYQGEIFKNGQMPMILTHKNLFVKLRKTNYGSKSEVFTIKHH